MSPAEATAFLAPAFPEPPNGRWADIGAGTGVFTLGLRSLLTAGEIWAVDKNPHALWSLPLSGAVPLHILEGDFHHPLELPLLDGLLMANALHYTPDPLAVLQHLREYLHPGAPLLLIEYDTEQPLSPWVPYPISYARALALLPAAGFEQPAVFQRQPSRYRRSELYGVKALARV